MGHTEQQNASNGPQTPTSPTVRGSILPPMPAATSNTETQAVDDVSSYVLGEIRVVNCLSLGVAFCAAGGLLIRMRAS